MSVPDIFDRAARRLRRDRATASFAAHDFLRRAMLGGIDERLAAVRRNFVDVLEIGSFTGDWMPPAGALIARLDAGFAFARASGGVQGDEDRLPFADGSFDLVISAGVLDTVNDLPGALLLARRVLRPDGLMLAAFVGAGTLPALRAVLGEAERERPVARLHPQVDVRAAGDLLVRAGFALPVADVELVTVRYRDLFRLLGDVRGMAESNLLVARHPLSRLALARAAEGFAARTDRDGRFEEQVALIFLTGWAPAPTQPKPARRGSATGSLAEALRAARRDKAAD